MSIDCVFETPFGNFLLTTSDLGLTRATFTDRPIQRNFHPILDRAKDQIEQYFDGDLQFFDLPIDWMKIGSTEFALEVYRLLQNIPYGKTRSYQNLADYLGRPKSARAIGRINGANPLTLIVPCHRVIGSGGKLVGYAHGLDIKRELLHLERSKKIGIQAELFSSAELGLTG